MKSEIEKLAYDFAKKWHEGYYRNDNITPYIVHPISVVSTLRAWGVGDSEVIAAAYLHDLLEDTKVKESELRQVFGLNVLMKVKKLTKNEKIPKDEYMNEIAKDADVYVSLIKYADRISNVIDFLVDGKEEYAYEYYHKADAIYNRLSSERKALGKIFDNLRDDKEALDTIFETIKKDTNKGKK